MHHLANTLVYTSARCLDCHSFGALCPSAGPRIWNQPLSLTPFLISPSCGVKEHSLLMNLLVAVFPDQGCTAFACFQQWI